MASVLGCVTVRDCILFTDADIFQAVISLQGACAAQIVKREQYGMAMGLMMGVVSIAYVIFDLYICF